MKYLKTILVSIFTILIYIGCDDKPSINESILNEENKIPHFVFFKDMVNQSNIIASFSINGVRLRSENNGQQVRIRLNALNNDSVLKHELYLSSTAFPNRTNGLLLTDVPSNGVFFKEITDFSQDVIIKRQDFIDLLGINPSLSSWGNNRPVYIFGKTTAKNGSVIFNPWTFEVYTREEMPHAYSFQWRIKSE
jgi:hypothetical protein